MENNEALQNQAHHAESQKNESQQDSALQLCQKELQDWKERAQRMAADFENFKKRLEKDQAHWNRMIQADIFVQLLDIVDNFERALNAEKDQSQLTGFVLIYKNLQKLLEKNGVTEIKDVAHFNPQLHEAVMNVQSETHKPGDIVQVLQKGYMFKDQVLRPAKVSIAE